MTGRTTTAIRHTLRLMGMLIAAGLCAGEARASYLQAPHIGGRDGALSGNVVATPLDGASILLFNPAGVVGRPTEVTTSLIVSTLSGRYSNSQTGYDQKSSEMPFGPLLWISSDRLAPWYVGAGLYGTVGSSFNFGAQPDAGVPGQFLSESGLIQCGFVVGREIAPGLSFGVQLAPSWGRIRTKTPSPLGAVDFDVNGFGISATTGILYDLNDKTTFGLSYRSPGVVYMSGDGDVGGQDDDVAIDFRTPQGVVFGVAYRFTPRLMVTAQTTWTNYPEFEEGVFEFEQHPQLNQSFIGDARSTFRYGIGAEYEWADWLWLRAGVSREEWMIEASSVSPLLYDTTDFMMMIGLGIVHGHWGIDANVGYAFMEDRQVTTADQTSFPGRYQLEASPGVTIGFTYRFDAEADE
ncbi:MAG: outer membrane protein transport protein [Deltaproteobacteria bacterium]|nr:outer membrane protein transport protein [Deltaproteobacteria bacterium]